MKMKDGREEAQKPQNGILVLALRLFAAFRGYRPDRSCAVAKASGGTPDATGRRSVPPISDQPPAAAFEAVKPDPLVQKAGAFYRNV